jgi:hypothetical protein
VAQFAGFFTQGVLFLFAGLFIPFPSSGEGWHFLFYINPLFFACQPVWDMQVPLLLSALHP